MISLQKSTKKELKSFYEISQQKHVTPYLNPKKLVRYEEEFLDKNFIYLSIIKADKTLVGYLLLSNSMTTKCMQLKRIVIDEKYLGIGKEVFVLVERYCFEKMGVNCLCLDVYADNVRAISLYEKLGYMSYDKGIENGRVVWFYEKKLMMNE